MVKTSSLVPHPSSRDDDWRDALLGNNDALLEELTSTDDPAASLFMIETYINGQYRAGQHPLFASSTAELHARVQRASPYADRIRTRVGWQIREFDLGLLRFIRRSSALSPVLGAGVSMGAGAPSWSELVRLMLEQTLEKGLELFESVPSSDNPAEPPITVLPDGSVRMGGDGTWRYEQRVREVRRYAADQEKLAREIMEEIKQKGAGVDVERLMQGAQVCYDLCGQHLFRLITGILYARAKQPSETHRAIAELAHSQRVPDRGPALFPGWDSIITYNFDGLMSEALSEQKVPHAAWAMKGDEPQGDPDPIAQNSDWHQSIFHLHGYTPRRLFLITDVRFVFSTSQYLTVYQGPRSAILDAVFRSYLANPVHIALYIGCSFSDEAMNRLLKDAFEKYPGRYHYALLKWPGKGKGKTRPSAKALAEESVRYLEMGVRPVWFDDFDELPQLIRGLK